MRRVGEFLKTTAIGGLLVLLPLLLLYLLLTEALGLVVALATPILGLFPKGTFDQAHFPVLMALSLIVGASFVIGLAMRSEIGKRSEGWIEKTILSRLPAYGVLKNLTTGFIASKEGAAFRPAVLTSPDGEQGLAYVIEEHGDGRLTVFLPWSPTPFAGSVKIVDRNRIKVLDAKLVDVTKVLSEWGFGFRHLLDKKDNGADPFES